MNRLVIQIFELWDCPWLDVTFLKYNVICEDIKIVKNAAHCTHMSIGLVDRYHKLRI